MAGTVNVYTKAQIDGKLALKANNAAPTLTGTTTVTNLTVNGTVTGVTPAKIGAQPAVGGGTANTTTFLRGDNTWAVPNYPATYTDEQVMDVVGNMLKPGTGVTLNYDDGNNILTINSTGAGGTTDTEVVRDTIAAALTAGTNITITNNDAGDTITLAVSGLSPVATSGLYSDLTGAPTLATVATTGSYIDLADKPAIPNGYVDEQARDAAAGLLTSGVHSGITFVYDDTNDRVNATVTASGGGGGTTDAATPYGTVWLDSFTGASDDAKLAAALSTVAADTYPRAIQLSARSHSFATAITAFDGMKIFGPGGYSNPERGGAAKSAMKIQLTMTGAWINSSGTNYQVSLRGLAFSGSSNATVMNGTFYCLSMRDIFSSGLKSLLGTQSTKILLTAANFSGDWEINNCYNGAFHIGGSDNTLWTDGMLLDSGTAFNTSGGATGQYHLWFDSCEKTYVGPLYVTCEGPWGGVLVDGPAFGSTSSNQGGPISITGARIEGRNNGAPCYGANIRQNGGILILDKDWISYGLSNPSAFGGVTDQGVIQHNGGQLVVDHCTYDHATSVAETVPWIYTASTADLQVTHTTRASKGGTWTGRPRVAKGAQAENRIVDSTVTLI